VRQKQETLTLIAIAQNVPGVRRGGVRGSWLLGLIALLLWQCTGSAVAQFTGPSLGSSASVNLPMKPTTDPAILYPGPREVHLDHGDLLTIHLYGSSSDYLPSARVSVDGSIQLPLIGLVHVAGLSLHEAQDLIAERLTAAGMYRDPQVWIQVVESPNEVVTITGEMHAVIPILGGQKRLFDVMAAAGGLSVTSSHTITINRPGVPEPIIIDLGTNPAMSAYSDVPIFAGDTIVVSRVGVIYMLGAFKLQGPIPLQQNSPLTLMQAAAIGGGPGWEGKSNDLRIIRTVGLERKVVVVDLKRIFNGRDPDPILQTDDIVFLPSSTMKAAIKGGGIGTTLAIASTLLYASAY
jgi:polysaccharide export outer membrane protein